MTIYLGMCTYESIWCPKFNTFFQVSLKDWNEQKNNLDKQVSRSLEKRKNHNKTKKNRDLGIPVPGQFVRCSEFPAIFSIFEADDDRSDSDDDQSIYSDFEFDSDGSSEFWESEAEWQSDSDCSSEFWDSDADWELETDSAPETEIEAETDDPAPKSMYYKQLAM